MHNRKQLALLEVCARKATAAHAADDGLKRAIAWFRRFGVV
jgi:hypothetical protein